MEHEDPNEPVPAAPATEPVLSRLYTEDRELPCALTMEELLAKGDALAQALRALDAEKDTQAIAKSDMRKALEELQEDISRLRQQVQERREFRRVPVEIRIKDLGHGLVAEVRKDTGEIIRERFMTEAERQRPLPM